MAGRNQVAVRRLLTILATVVFGLLLSIPGLARAQYRFYPIDVKDATRTAANGNSTHEIVGDFDDADENTHGFVLNKGVFTTVDVPKAVSTSINGINAPGRIVGTYLMPTQDTPHAFVGQQGRFYDALPPGLNPIARRLHQRARRGRGYLQG